MGIMRRNRAFLITAALILVVGAALFGGVVAMRVFAAAGTATPAALPAPRPGTPLFDDGQQIGELITVCFSPTAASWLGPPRPYPARPSATTVSPPATRARPGPIARAERASSRPAAALSPSSSSVNSSGA